MKQQFLVLCFGMLWALSGCANAQAPATPVGVRALAFERHVALRWSPSPSSNVKSHNLYVSTDGGQTYTLLKKTGAEPLSFDWIGNSGNGATRHYKVAAVNASGQESPLSDAASATIPANMSDDQWLDMAQEATFRYFWEFAHPVSGMARERNASGDVITSGGTGFGLMALVVATERGWITRADALQHFLKVISFLQIADRFHGVFPHWMDGNTGNVVPFSQYDNGGDLVETAFLIQGLLAARQYFDRSDPLEKALRDAITKIWEDVEWDWYRRNNSGVLYWHWSPNYGWQMNFPLRGFYEAQIVYILAIASPKHPVPASLYQSGWTSQNYANNSIHFGYPIYCGPFGGGPLFFAHYSYLGFDPRGKKDAFCNYFTRNRNHGLIQQAYCAINPKNYKGYSAECWGLTASDTPQGYSAHDISPAGDKGTITPTAALSNMPYTPTESMAALRHFYRFLGDRLWGNYGFYDAFNLQQNWFADSYLAIDQGPIVAMIENYRTGLLWRLFMQNSEIQPALDAIGFVKDVTSVEGTEGKAPYFAVSVSPNPISASGELQIQIETQEKRTLSAWVVDTAGRKVQDVFAQASFTAGINQYKTRLQTGAKGLYLLRVQDEHGRGTFAKIVQE